MRLLAAALCAFALAAQAQQKEIKIGFIYDVSGRSPARLGAGADRHQGGDRHVQREGGVMGYKINAVFADAQSKVDVAINEMTRLVDQEKVDIVAGVYSSAQCVPMVQQIEARKKFLWLNVCIATAVFKDRKLNYVFARRRTPTSSAPGLRLHQLLREVQVRRRAKNMRVAIIHEDGPYGVGVAAGNESQCKKHGMNIVLKEGYSASAPDLSSLVTKLKRARPDVLLHTGYNPDITLFLRQSKEQGFKVKAIIGHGAGHSQIDKLRQTFGEDVNYFTRSIRGGAAPRSEEAQARRLGPDPGDGEALPGGERPGRAAADVSMGFNNTWILLNDVLPRAIKQYGGFDSEALRKAALDTDIPVGGTLQGYGVNSIRRAISSPARTSAPSRSSCST